ncbi:RHS repeat domain-containing protein [Aequorivita marina]|uniref:RHS repeat domain-containing protein n=1 Tax=Aequorivita marina TaxID=3073654 RepID=UPI002876FF35|nr:hypothetical protein [Aequorivita sp. S2608]MDS1297986.1 hypothetical protein [Aequorivita sp. S2608]
MMQRTSNKFNSAVLLILSLSLLTACQSTKPLIKSVKKVNDLEKMDLKGPVKTMKVKSYKISVNSRTGKVNNYGLSKIKPKNLVYLFNKDGNIVEKRTYDGKGQLRAKSTYTYDIEKREIIEKTYKDANEVSDFRQVTYYDKNGNKTKLLSYSKGEDEPYKETFTYDQSGNILEEIKHRSSGLFKTQYNYDNEGRLIEKTIYNAENLLMTETYAYDEKGNLQTAVQDENRTVHAKYIFKKKYKDGKEIERKSLKNGAVNGRFVYSYNDQGQRIEYKKYDESNNLVSGEKTDFEYDDKNNWIQKIPFDPNGFPKRMIEREIEYFGE